MEKFQVIFYGDGEEAPYTEQYFSSEGKAEDWVNDNKSYSEDYFEITYYNPQDKQNYDGYKIIQVNELNEEFISMQKIAGLLTEEKYKEKSKELDLMNLSNKISEKCNLIKQHLKRQGYDI